MKEKPSISRADFIQFAKLGIPGLLLAVYGIEHKEELFVYTLSELIRHPKLMSLAMQEMAAGLQTFALADQRHPDAPVIVHNPTYTPILDQLASAIEHYAQNGGQVRYQRNPGWKSSEYYLNALTPYLLQKPLLDENGFIYQDAKGHPISLFEELIRGGFTFEDRMKKLVPSEAKQLFNAEHVEFTSHFVFPGSGFAKRISLATGLDFRQLMAGRNGEVVGSLIDAELSQTLRTVENLVKDNDDNPIATSLVLSKYLEMNDGNLTESIMDVALFLKYIARFHFDTGKHPFDDHQLESNALLVKRLILDEYGVFGNYQRLSLEQYPYHGWLTKLDSRFLPGQIDQDFSLINHEGKPYHIWMIVAKLAAFDITTIQVGYLLQQSATLNEQGLLKTASGLRELADLMNIDRYLMSFS